MAYKNIPEYRIWKIMLQRCKDEYKGKRTYKSKGIKVCERWQDYSNFYADMGKRPDGYSLDRIDNNLGYFPENCRWANFKTQNRNRDNNIYGVYQGETKLVIEWAELFGINYVTLWNNVKKKESFEHALNFCITKKIRKLNKKIVKIR